jgi:anti-sigma factor ChrR (cupin superfamily)
MKKTAMTIVLAALLAGGSAFAAGAAKTTMAPKKKPHPAVKPDALQWMQPFGPTGPQIALVEGKFGDTKPASFFAKFTAGQNSPWHFHHHDYEGVVLKGTFTEQQIGEEIVQLPAGTWFSQPGIQVHQNTCVAGGDECLVFVHFDKGADSVVTDEMGKVVPMPKAGAAASPAATAAAPMASPSPAMK